MTQSEKYIPHLDGLRALAVVAVIFFHYHIPGFQGGYVGVDIFFVISGFLITGIIQKQYQTGKFTFLSFYKKRFYRIYPALLFVNACTFVLAAFLFSPSHLENMGKNLLGALSFTSNFVYWRSIGYFQVLDSYDPFVPTWSLSIEIQYYLLFPVFYILLLRFFPRQTGGIILAVAIASLLLAEIGLRYTNNFVYYNLPFRFFEFAVGSLCCLTLGGGQIKRLNTRFFPLAGTGLILLSLVLFDNQTPFPGVWALLPCIGAACIILSDRRSVGYRLFDNPLSIYIGKISYSFYLIHWPVYVLFSYWYFNEVSLYQKFFLFLVAAGLAVLTYHFIENSYRRRDLSFIKQVGFALCVAMMFGLSYSVYSQTGWPWRLSDSQKALLAQINSEDQAFKADFDKKFPASGETKFTPEKHAGLECSYNNTKDAEVLLPCLSYHLTRKNGQGFLVIGDSNGANTYRALELAYPDQDFAMLQQAGCAAAAYLEDNRSGSYCFKDLKKILAALEDQNVLKGIILTSRWVLQPYQNVSLEGVNKNIPVMIFGATPMLRHDTFETLWMLGENQNKETQVLSLRAVGFEQDLFRADEFLSHIPDVIFISKAGLLCPHEECPLFIGSNFRPLFLDDQHLSSAGIEYFSGLLRNSNLVRDFLR